MSDIIQYISLSIGACAFAYTTIQNVFHRQTNKSNNISHNIKFNNLDSNIQNIKELFQKLINSNLFNSPQVIDIENQVKSEVENIVNYDYQQTKDVVQNKKTTNEQTINRVSNVLALLQNIQNHINTQQQQTEQASNNQLNVDIRKTVQNKKDDRVSIYEITPNEKSVS